MLKEELKDLIVDLESRISAGWMRPIKEQIIDYLKWEGVEITDKELQTVFKKLKAID
ncbi:hypothetical protein LR066_05250 [candidate division WOR-3 bacterium]|nr:hypothetical protein [candidate division WOR-3 bacterium]